LISISSIDMSEHAADCACISDTQRALGRDPGSDGADAEA